MPEVTEQPSELYLYGSIHSWSAEFINSQLEALMGEEATMRMNTPGGDVFAGWSIGSKMIEHGNVTLVIDGACMSMGFILPVFAKRSYAYDTTLFLTHKAFTWYNPSETDKAILAKVNKDLKAKLKAKINSKVFKEVTGHTFEQVFDGDESMDLILTAEQAKKIGLIDEVRKLKQSDVKAMHDGFKIAAMAMSKFETSAEAAPAAQENKDKTQPTIQKPSNMTIEEIRANHPQLFAQILALGVEQEKDRTGAWLAFLQIDSKAVAEGIESGKPISQTAMAKFQSAAIMASTAQALNKGSQGALATTVAEEEGLTAEQKVQASALKEVDSILGLNKTANPATTKEEVKA